MLFFLGCKFKKKKNEKTDSNIHTPYKRDQSGMQHNHISIVPPNGDYAITFTIHRMANIKAQVIRAIANECSLGIPPMLNDDESQASKPRHITIGRFSTCN